MNGTSPDIYLYTPQDGSLARLTSAPTFAIYPSWSPDDKYILHDAANQVWEGYSGRGHWIAAVWVAPQNGSAPRRLFESRFSSEKGFENRHGWLSDSFYLASAESAWCDATDLRIVDLENGDQTAIWQGTFYDVALDPATSTVLILIPDDASLPPSEDCPPHENPGLYMLSLASLSTQLLAPVNPGATYPAMQWSSNANLFFVDTDRGLLSITPEGELGRLLPDLTLPTVSPDGRLWALPGTYGQDLWIGGPDTAPRPIFNGQVGAITWAPDNTALIFVGQSESPLRPPALYFARAPEFAPQATLEGIPEYTPLAWVTP